jgi:hypothetical protein
MKTTRKPYVFSARLGAKLSTSRDAAIGRARAAILASGLPVETFTACNGKRDSETEVALDNGVLLLVSYQTVVAFRLPGSKNVAAVTLGHHSRTTDRSIRDFSKGGELVELAPSAFLEAVADAAAL